MVLRITELVVHVRRRGETRRGAAVHPCRERMAAELVGR
jgi:hypothetical protein